MHEPTPWFLKSTLDMYLTCTYVHVHTACTCARRRDERPARDVRRDARRPRAASQEETSKHVLLQENYGKDKVVDKEWVLLEAA